MVLGWLLLACAPRPPSARIEDVALTALSWDAASAEVRVAVDNPLPVEVPLTGLRWSLAIADRPLLSGSSTAPTAIAADATTVVPVPVVLRYDDLAAALGADAEAVPYRVELALDLDTPAGPITLPLAHAGTLPDLEPPTLDLVTVDLRQEGTVGVLALEVALGLPAWVSGGSLGWALALDPHLLGRGEATLAGGRLRVEARVDAAALAGAAWDAWSGVARVLRFDLEGRLATSFGTLPFSASRELVVP